MGTEAMEHFNIGDKVIVVKNTERIPEEARLGEHGKIVGFKSNDCIVEFDGKLLGYIVYHDLAKDTWETIRFEETPECFMKMANWARKVKSTFSVEYGLDNVTFKLGDDEFHLGEKIKYQTTIDTTVAVQTCPKCKGTGMCQIAPGVRGIKVCPVCKGKKKNWSEEDRLREVHERETSDYVLYGITNGIKGVYSIAEVVDDSNKRPEKTIFLNLYKTYERSGESKQMAHSLKAVENMLKANGVVVFSGEKALLEVAKYLNTVEG